MGVVCGPVLEIHHGAVVRRTVSPEARRRGDRQDSDRRASVKKRLHAVPFHPARLPFFYGYAIVALTVIGMLMSVPGQTMGVSAFTDYLIRDLRITRVNLTTAYMIGTILSSLMLPWAGRMYDRFGARILAVAAGGGLGVTLLLLTASPSVVGRLGSWLPWAGHTVVGLFVMSACFFLLRFFGQGTLTMTSRNMLMKWFERHRGLANGFCSVFVAFGFSLSPQVLNGMIDVFTWQGAWQVLAAVIGIAFCAVAAIFFRDNPEECGLMPDGRRAPASDQPEEKEHAGRQFTLAEARRTYSFWVFVVALALLGLYYTAFTFHVASIFEEAGRTRGEAFAVFFPASVISVSVSFISGWASDRVRLKYLLMTMLAGMLVSMLGICTLEYPLGKIAIIVGNGVAVGHLGLLGSVTWPTFYGREHLGAISGFGMAATVFGSAIGPWMFSLSLSATHSYAASSMICMVVAALLLACAVRANGPQAPAAE